jgi:hypothetical protein
MVNFLDRIAEVLPAIQQAMINTLIAQKKKIGGVVSIRSQQDEIIRLYNEIKSNLGNILLKPRYAVPDTKISSDDHNYNMEKIYLDLNSLYAYITQIDKSSKLQSISLDSTYQKSRAAIQKLINDARVFALRKKYLDFNEIKVIDFNFGKNTTEILPRADINPKTRLLQLKEIGNTRVQFTNRNNKITKVYTKTISTGIKASLSKSFPPENMVDQKPESFWSTMVMSDYPITQKYSITSRNGSTSQVNVAGPIIEIYFKFSHLERINHIRLLPFADYPIKIIDIAYRPSIESSILTTVSDFTSSTTLDWEEYNFSSIFTNEIRVSIAQENFKRIYYQVPEAAAKNTDIFQKIYDSKLAGIIGSDIIDSDNVVESARAGSLYGSAIQSLNDVLRIQGDQYKTKNKIDYYYTFNKIISDVLAPINPEITKESIFGGYTEEELTSPRLVQVKKFEYLLGIREIEMGYALYSSVGHFATEKLEVQATIAEVQIEVDERHPLFQTAWQNDYRKTSTEWAVNLGDGRIIPVHPRNIVDEENDYPIVKDELIRFDPSLGVANTRLGGRTSSVLALKKDGQIIPEQKYNVARLSGSIPSLKITMTGSEWYDPNSIYTTDYYVDSQSYSISVLNKYQSRELFTPEVYTGTGPNNSIELTKYPFIDYTVINLTDYFFSSGDAEWSYYPPSGNVSNSGLLKIKPTVLDSLGNILQTGATEFQTYTGIWGNVTGNMPFRLQGNTEISPVYFGELSGINFGYFFQVMDSNNLYEITGFTDIYSGAIREPLVVTVDQIKDWNAIGTGFAFSGDLTGAYTTGYLQLKYTFGIGLKTDDQTFGLNNSTYVPISITVDGRKAKNITDYYTLKHPAFSVSANQGVDYEYIQAGKKIYFNQPITQEIKVNYRWLTDYIQLQGVLRSNSPINPDVTPKVNEVRLLINNSVI